MLKINLNKKFNKLPTIFMKTIFGGTIFEEVLYAVSVKCTTKFAAVQSSKI